MASDGLSLHPSAIDPLEDAVKNTSKYFSPGYSFNSRSRINCVHDVSKGAGLFGVQACVKLLGYGGYRIAEVLGCRWSDVLPGDRIIVRAVKRGTASIAHLPGVSECLFHVPPTSRDSFIFSCTYTQVYSWMLTHGWAMQKPGRHTRSVTHTPRNQMAQQVVMHSGRLVASNLLHHINSDSLNFYVPPIVYPYITWSCHLIGFYVGFYPTPFIDDMHCITSAYGRVVGSYPPGVSNAGGSIPPHPSDNDPCMHLPNVPFAGLSLRYWSGRQFPVTFDVYLWLGVHRYDFNHVFQQSELT